MADKIIRKLFANDSTAVEQPGKTYRDEITGNVYKYVLAEDANILKGDVVEYSDVTGYEVTKDRAGGSSLGRLPAGVAITTITDAQYGWIQVSGINNYVRTDGGVAVGDALIPHVSADGQADTHSTASTVVLTAAQVFGYALNTDTTTTTPNCKAIIRCL